MDPQFWLGIVLGALITGVFWFFRPDWLRRKVGLDPKPPYHAPGIDFNVLKADPVIGARLPDGAQLSWQLEAKVPLALQQGYSHFTTEDGRQVAFIRSDHSGQATLALLVKPSAGRTA